MQLGVSKRPPACLPTCCVCPITAPMRPGTTQFRPTGPGERKEERQRAQGQMSELPFPRVPLIMLVRNRREQTLALTFIPPGFSAPVSQQVPHPGNHGMVQGWALHSALTRSSVVSGPHLPAATLANCLAPLCLSFSSRLVNACQVFRSRPSLHKWLCYLCVLAIIYMARIITVPTSLSCCED